MKNNLKKRIFCPVCGELKVEDGKVIHPALDKEQADILKHGFEVHYTK